MNQQRHETITNLPNNIRFYIIIFSLALSLFTASWLRIHIQSDQLFYIRTEQIFGFIAIAYWYLALLLSPLSKAIGKRKWMDLLLFARRSIGVSAAYFAFLHGGVAFWGQLDGFDGVALLPDIFRTSLLFGLVGLVVLSLMAATSFNKVVAYMTPQRWKRLHRLGYIGGVLVILHIWIVGTHIEYAGVRIIALIALALLFGLESLRIMNNVAKRYEELRSKDILVTLIICLWLTLVGLVLMLPRYVSNYHSQHSATHKGSQHE